MTPPRPTSPKVGFNPTMPQKLAGLRIDPPVSVPIAPGTNPAATAAADPLLDPEVKCSRFQGLRGGGQGQIVRGLAVREFVCGELADKDAPGFVEPGHKGRIGRRNMVGENSGVCGCRDAGGVDDVLERERNPVHRAAISPGADLGFGRLRLTHRVFGRERDEGLDLRVDRIDPAEKRLDKFDRRQFLASNQPGPPRRWSNGKVRRPVPASPSILFSLFSPLPGHVRHAFRCARDEVTGNPGSSGPPSGRLTLVHAGMKAPRQPPRAPRPGG